MHQLPRCACWRAVCHRRRSLSLPSSSRSPIPTASDATAEVQQTRREGLHSGSRWTVLLAGAATALLLCGLTVWIFHLQLFDRWSFPWDFLGTYTTTPAFVADTIGRGHPLFWSPFVASGFPVDVNPQAGVYFPLWWLLGALHIRLTLHALTVVQIGHVLLGAIGVMLLARARRVAWPWAIVAAVAYLFFGGFYGQAEHADIFRGFAYLPWLLWSLTPPTGEGRWYRLGALPVLAWIIVTGAYPGETVSFAIAGFVYVAVALRVDARSAWRRYRWALLLAVIASIGVCVAVLVPYLRAEHAGELYRTIEPTAAERAMFSISPLDIFGLYLNNFSWTYEGTITSWAVGVPILIGLACVRRPTLRRHAPLIACGVMALILGMAPKIGPIGSVMASLRPLFPSRFPASDYKAVVAIALIVVSVDAWGCLANRIGRRPWIGAVAAVVVLIAGALLVPSTHAKPTYALWLLILVALLAASLALWRPRWPILMAVLIALVVVDGAREISDYRLAGTVSPWKEAPASLAFFEARSGETWNLAERLRQPVKSRPARVPTAPTAEQDASGWIADAYYETDYDPTLERSLWRAEHNPAWSAKLLEPWHAYTFPCSQVGCSSGQVHLPPASRWKASDHVETLSYGGASIVYSVDVTQPVLMVENELSVAGWGSNSDKVSLVRAGIPLRAWRLAPGRYRFVAHFQEPDRWLQWAALSIALIAWMASSVVMLRAWRSRRQPKSTPGMAAGIS